MLYMPHGFQSRTADGKDGGTGVTTSGSPGATPTGRQLARKLRDGYRRHDSRDRAGAIVVFTHLDRCQFPHLSGAEARAAATALVDALWEKDAVEEPYVTDGVVEQPGALAAADWSGVETALDRRAEAAGIDPAYATLTTTGWKRHKIGGDYATPILEAQRLEVEAALRTDTYPQKSRAGLSGFGELPARYLVAVELHDDRTPEAADRVIDVMTPYFETILEAQGEDQ